MGKDLPAVDPACGKEPALIDPGLSAEGKAPFPWALAAVGAVAVLAPLPVVSTTLAGAAGLVGVACAALLWVRYRRSRRGALLAVLLPVLLLAVYHGGYALAHDQLAYLTDGISALLPYMLPFNGDQVRMSMLEMYCDCHKAHQELGWNYIELRNIDGISLTIWQDQSKVLRDRLSLLVRNGLTGLVLVFIALTLFLKLRVAFWLSVGIPVSFLGAVLLMPGTGAPN